MEFHPLSAPRRTMEDLVSESVETRDWERAAALVTEGGVSVQCRERVLTAALKDCQWPFITTVLHQGVSIECRDTVMKEALRHSQWSYVALLLTLGVSGQSRDAVFQKAARYKQWECVDMLLALGVSQSQRDAAMQRAVLHEEWEFVDKLLQAGVSQQQRDQVVEKAAAMRQWQVVRQLVRVGISPQERDSVTETAIDQQQWGCVVDLLRAGVTLRGRKLAVDKALQACALVSSHQTRWKLPATSSGFGSTKRMRLSAEPASTGVGSVMVECPWDWLPDIVAAIDDDFQKKRAVLAAVGHCQWNCVARLVQLGLSQPLKELIVAGDTVPCGHVDCAAEALRYGIGFQNQQWIVEQLFRLGRWRRVVDLLAGGAFSAESTNFALERALAYKEYNAFIAIVQTHCVTDRAVSNAMMTALSVGAVHLLYNIIRTTRSGRRVFKQLCLQWRWTVFDFQTTRGPAFDFVHSLVADKEEDLALFLAAAHHLWDCVLDLYNSGVSKRTRRRAFRLALRHGAWPHVIKLAAMSVTHAGQRRQAFLAAVRQGEWRAAIQLCAHGLTLSRSDERYAVKTCLLNGQWEFVTEYCQKMSDSTKCKALLKTVSYTTAKNNLVDSFMNIFGEPEMLKLSALNGRQLVRLACDTALKSGECDFVLSLCESATDCWDSAFSWLDVTNIAVESSIKSKNWDLLSQLLEKHDILLSVEDFVKCVGEITKRRDRWYKCAPFLDAWCKENECFLGELENMWRDKDKKRMRRFVKWCMKTAYVNLSLYVALLSEHWSLAAQVGNEVGHNIDDRVLEDGLYFASSKRQLDTAVSLLQFTEPDDTDLDIHFDYLSDEEMSSLLEKCRQKRLRSWVIEIVVANEKWDILDTVLGRCQDQILINKSVQAANDYDQRDFLAKYLHKCSLDEESLGDILRSTLRDGSEAEGTECVRILLEKIDPVDVTLRRGSPSLMGWAMLNNENKEVMLRLCVRAGLSPHQRQQDLDLCGPMRQAIDDRELPLARLLHESGSCSNRELHQLRTNSALKDSLVRDGREELYRYIDHAASNPPSLQNLSRLAVSGLLGCRPGRAERIQSLDATWVVKDFLAYKDLCPPESG